MVERNRVLLGHARRVNERTRLVADAIDGPEAIAATKPDIVVLDDNLAVVRGRDVAVQLRVLDRLARPSARPHDRYAEPHGLNVPSTAQGQDHAR